MNLAPIVALAFLSLLILVFIFYKRPKKKIILSDGYKEYLKNHVAYYNRLDENDKFVFEEKIKEFLGYVRIDGIDTNVDETDKILVASSAVIPTFGFKKWKFFNLRNVLIYPGSFNKDEFLASGFEQNTLGMIGNGPMQNVMILSKAALQSGFQMESSKSNTGIHEFVHLLDKEDGYVDGLPEALLKKNFNNNWIQLVNQNIQTIMEGSSDINYYGATNRAEFLAVVSEYFFNLPELFKQNHPELFEALCTIFNQDPNQSKAQ